MTGQSTAAGLDATLTVTRASGFALTLSMRIAPGATVALLGPNGAGKSTTVDVLAGLEPLDDGRLVLDGRVLDDPHRRIFVAPHERRVGVVFQQYLLFDHLDVRDNVAFGPVARGVGRSAARSIAADWLAQLELTELAARRPDELSGGQAQRVALARALATDPALLLLDEPLAALDIETRTHLRRLLAAHLATYSGPRLLITHDPTDAFLLADQIHVLEGGTISQVGTPDEIRRRPATPYVAALAGLNLFTGRSDRGAVTLDAHDLGLLSADTRTTGAVLVTIKPSAVALHGARPHGSPRNSWSTTVGAIERLGDIVRVILGPPLPLSVDVTPEAVAALDLAPAAPVWASVKATEVQLNHA